MLLNNESETTNILYFTRFWIDDGKVSNGIIVFEKNSKTVPNEIAPIVDVSSELNT